MASCSDLAFVLQSSVEFSAIEDSNGVLGGKSSPQLSSSEGEESDGDIAYPSVDVDLQVNKDRLEAPGDSLTAAAHRLANLRQGDKRKR